MARRRERLLADESIVNLLQEEYIIGTGGANTGSLDNTAQNELFENPQNELTKIES